MVSRLFASWGHAAPPRVGEFGRALLGGPPPEPLSPQRDAARARSGRGSHTRHGGVRGGYGPRRDKHTQKGPTNDRGALALFGVSLLPTRPLWGSRSRRALMTILSFVLQNDGTPGDEPMGRLGQSPPGVCGGCRATVTDHQRLSSQNKTRVTASSLIARAPSGSARLRRRRNACSQGLARPPLSV